jgi:hypothetical protein
MLFSKQTDRQTDRQTRLCCMFAADVVVTWNRVSFTTELAWD